MPIIDLHCHTTASDGLVAPADLVRHAAEHGVDVVAVTDHDTVAGVGEALRASMDLDVRVVPGIELSTRHDDREIHVLGYFIDPDNARLAASLTEMRAQREERTRRIVERLRDLGYVVSLEDVHEQAGGDVLGRPHIARALVARGYIPDVRSAFTTEFIGDGGRAFVPRVAMSALEAVGLVRHAGGVAVVAHPGVTHHEGQVKPLGDEAIAALAAAGLAGLEVDHPDHPPLVRDRLQAIAHEYGLIPTGGSDWHGHPEHTLGRWATSEASFRRLEQKARAGG